MVTTINAKEYSTRAELEDKVRSMVGLVPDIKEGYEIRGTQKELKRLQLSGRTIFWGIQCVESDPDPPKPVTERPPRGKLYPFGKEGNLKKPPK